MATPLTSAVKAPAHAKESGGFDLLRPVRYTAAITKGAAGGLLNSMATYGRKGFWTGVGLGLITAIATGGTSVIGTMGMFAVGGLVTGSVLGAAGGTVVGAYRNATLQHRRTKYADEALERSQAKADRAARQQAAADYSYRDTYALGRHAQNYNFERSLQQERENDQDYNRYWQDRMDNERHHHGGGRGW